MLVIERDQEQGERALFKRIDLVDLRQTDADGYLPKGQIIDLLAIGDPSGIAQPARQGDVGTGNPFRFPFVTIESVVHLDGNVVAVVNDNNYPFSTGRNLGRPDDTEIILVRLSLAGASPGVSSGVAP